MAVFHWITCLIHRMAGGSVCHNHISQICQICDIFVPQTFHSFFVKIWIVFTVYSFYSWQYIVYSHELTITHPPWPARSLLKTTVMSFHQTIYSLPSKIAVMLWLLYYPINDSGLGAFSTLDHCHQIKLLRIEICVNYLIINIYYSLYTYVLME